jgi:hypothetical protein
MTQDQPGQARGTGSAVRGEVVPDDETEVTQDEQPGPMTRFKRVASALRGDRPDQTAADPDQTAADPAGAISGPGSEEYAHATRPDGVTAVRSPDTGNGGSWDDEQDADATIPDGTPAPGVGSDPFMTGPDTYGTTVPAATIPAATGTVSAPDYGDEADTEAEAAYGSPAGTEAGYSSQTGATPGYGSQTGTAPGSGSQTGTAPGSGREAGTATGYGNRVDTATGPQGLTGAGPASTEAGTEAATAESTSVGRHAAAEDAGLRPGEATDRLGDFGDIAFGNLLPDAGQYSAQWQQIQFRFVDDPQASVTEAADVISQVTAKLEAAIQERQRAIEDRQRAIQERASALRGRWGEGSNADTETLRETLRMYRAFMDQLIGPTS